MNSRNKVLQDIQAKENFDVIVIGGGVVGLGAGADAASRGLKTVVFEKYDFAKGTSSRATKLLHGGVRYLAQMNFKLVKDSLREKERLYKNAPHLTNDSEFFVPCYSYFDLFFYRSGFFLYDFLAGFPKGHTSETLSKKDVIEKYPNAKKDGLVGGVLYHDGIFDDARMALGIAENIETLGSYVVNYVSVVEFVKENGKIAGVIVEDNINKEKFTVKSNCVVNATGIFSDDVRKLDDASAKPIVMHAQGSHIILDNKKHFNTTKSLLVPKTEDGRVLFSVPWYDVMIVGTTDTKVNKAEIEPKVKDEEIDFIINNMNKYLEKPITKQDILSKNAGIRPLIIQDTSKTSSISREEQFIKSDSGLVSAIGGKWTSYRRMSEKLVDFLIANSLLSATSSTTQDMKIYGYISKEESNNIEPHLRQYGSNLEKLKAIDGFKEKLHEKLPFNVAQVIYATRHEMAQNIDDFIARRTRCLFLNAKLAVEIAEKVAKIMAKELGKDEAWEKSQVAEFKAIAENYLPR